MENEVPETNEEEQVQETQAPASAEATADKPVVDVSAVASAKAEAAPEPAPIAPEVEVCLSNEQRTFALCSYLVPLVTSTTFIVPLIIWLLKKGEDAYVEKHAKESLNFQISFVIYACVAWMSVFVMVGMLLLPAVVIAYMVFAIVASVKAYKGEDYTIPLCIRFIK